MQIIVNCWMVELVRIIADIVCIVIVIVVASEIDIVAIGVGIIRDIVIATQIISRIRRLIGN